MAQALVHGAQLAAGRRQLRRLPDARPRAGRRLPGGAGQLGEPGPHRGPEDRGLRDRRRARRRARRPRAAGRQRRATSPRTGRATASTRPTASPTARLRACGASRPPAPRRSCWGTPVRRARDHRHRDPHRQPGVLAARRAGPGRVRRPHRRGHRRADPRARYRLLAAQEGVFVEPASAAGSPGCCSAAEQGTARPGPAVVCTVTGNGLKDPNWAIARRRRRADHRRPGRRGRRRGRARPRGLSVSRPVCRRPARGHASGSRRPAPTSAPASTPSAWRSDSTTTSSVRGAPTPVCTSTSRGEGAERCPVDETHLVVRSLRAALRRARAASRAGLRLRVRQPHPARPRPRLLLRRDRAPGFVAARAAGRRRARELDDARAARAGRPRSRATRTTSPPACSAASPWPGRDGGRPRRAVRMRPARFDRAGGLRPPARPVRPSPPAGCCRATVPHADAAANAGRAALLVARARPAPRPAARRHRGPAAPGYRAPGDAGDARAGRPLRADGLPAVALRRRARRCWRSATAERAADRAAAAGAGRAGDALVLAVEPERRSGAARPCGQ